MTKKLGSAFFIVLTAFLVYRFAVRYYFGEAREDAVDFPSYYYGAKLAFELHTSPYTNTGWNIAGEQYKNETGEETLFPFLYPPPSLLFFKPFTLLEYEPAKLLMLGINHALALVFILLFFFNILKLHAYDLLPIAGIYYFYNFFPLILTIYSGQVNLLILVLICLTWLGVKEKWHPLAIALPLALGIALKLYPVLFFIILLLRKEYKTIFYTVAILIGMAVISAPLLPYSAWGDWVGNVATKGYLHDIQGVATGKPANQSINALLIRTFFGLNIRFAPLFTPPDWMIRISPYMICGLVGLASLAATWRTELNKIEDNLNLQFSIWLLAMFMIAPISWDHHLVLILPAIYVAFHEAFKRKWYFILPILAGLAYFLALNFDFNNPAYREGWRTLLISAKLYAVTILWLFFIMLSFSKTKKRGYVIVNA
jgi:alpha-1,2-mannosyltransferase